MDSLGDRMKKIYEQPYKVVLPGRMPVICRLDGKAFHTYTRGCAKPFDEKLIAAMAQTAKAVCEEMQGAQLAYIQSDEISILIHNYKRLTSQSWFGNQLQKMASVSAGIASGVMTLESIKVFGEYRRAVFDSRVFILPEHDVCNYFLWRQQDWTRNSVQMLARSLYSHKECYKKNNAQLQEMCVQKGYNWNDLDPYLKRGICLTGSSWVIDKNIPIFSQDRNYIERYLLTEEPHQELII